MAVYLSPVFGAGWQLLTNAGVVLAGGSVTCYQAGTTTPQATFTDNTGGTPNANPIPLDSAGRLGSPTNVEMWLTGGQAYKFIVKDVNGVQVGLAWDNISGINDPGSAVAGSLNAWNVVAGTPTFISATQFSMTGNQTATFPVGTRVKSTVTAGTAYGVVSAVAFGAFTTVTLVNDGTTLDSGLSQVATSVNTVTGPNVGAAAVAYSSAITNPSGSVGADLVAKAAVAATTTTNLNAVSKAVSLAGGPTAFTLTPVPAIAAYVQGQTWLAQANVASSGVTTINISGQGVKSLKQLNSSGTKVDATLVNGGIYELAYDGTDVTVMNPTPSTGKLLRVTTVTASGTWTRGAGTTSCMVEAVGGGGGGGTGTSGGAGGYAKAYVASPGATETVIIGTAGAGTAAAAATAGGATSFGTTPSCVASGGVVTTGAGGVGTTGDVLLTGNAGATTGNAGFFGGAVGAAAAIANSGAGGATGGGTGFGGGTGRVVVHEFG
jgi:hypothetical protein